MGKVEKNMTNGAETKPKKEGIKKLRAKVYIDGANIFYTQKSLAWFINFNKLKDYLRERWQILGIKYYTGIKESDEKMKSFLRYLDKAGIEPVTKPLKRIKNKNKILFKSNFDVEMTMDILLERQSYEICILLTGDSDFHALVKKLRDFGKKVIVLSSRKMISWELKLSVDKYLFFEDIKELIKRDIKKPPPKRRSSVKLKIV